MVLTAALNHFLMKEDVTSVFIFYGFKQDTELLQNTGNEGYYASCS